MKNYRGGSTSLREVVTAAAVRTSGQAVVENDFAGVAEVNAPSGSRYTIRRNGEYEFPLVAGSAKGYTCFINETTFALTTAARGTAPSAGTRVFGRVTAVPGNPNTGRTADEPKAGKMWIRLEGVAA